MGRKPEAQVRQIQTRMPPDEECNAGENWDGVEDVEGPLVIIDVATSTFSELDETVDGPNQDHNGGQVHSAQ